MTSRIEKIENPSTRATPAENPATARGCASGSSLPTGGYIDELRDPPGTDEQVGITSLWSQAAAAQPAGSQFSRIREFLKKENKLGRI